MPDATISTQNFGATTLRRRFRSASFDRPAGGQVMLIIEFERVRTRDSNGEVISIEPIQPPLIITQDRLQAILPGFGLPSAAALRDGFIDLAASEYAVQHP
jgi:hypothetical protein